MDAGRDSGRARTRTAALMRSTVEQLRLAARRLRSLAETSPSEQTATRLRALGHDVSAKADDIEERADQIDDGTPTNT
ncbi:hypothetical protein Ate02nite_60410 [Paractinoplanes tereljensis]|uniref:Uncharacterized protein n=1 Tax=Paractinoplanes tereljensis TaxID=571912 RepID=A0A919NQM0_9ACTN|nr:hypothetical protein Ate02nite_60410 [Actinoplanes tereljensis]